MKYDYYAKKLEALWLRRKWWIVGVFALVVAAGAVAEFWPQSPEDKIKSALVDYHKAKGQKAEIKDLSFREVSAAYPDSLRLTAASEHFSRCGKTYLSWLNLTNTTKQMLAVTKSDTAFYKENYESQFYYAQEASKYKDSLNLIEAECHRLDSAFEAAKNIRLTFTKCNYVAKITASSESHTDTLMIVLNDKLNVVWPDKK